ncbi:ras GEF [Hygrophoropsis aurantiaca]|uniref:Ras GEF n=1 Tax=Hygrophoropsis aurantiaca TaxID=72124 RepID=A0ACB8AJ77_9AGAM|nr:ras GEF [Hygrophoropsis aurantiaca]
MARSASMPREVFPGSGMRHSIVRGLPAIPTAPILKERSQSTDFWIPQVTDNGQIYYTNTVTGQVSRDLPKETEDDISSGDLAGLAASQSSSRSGTGATLGLTYGSDQSSAYVGALTETADPVLAEEHPYDYHHQQTGNGIPEGLISGSLTAPIQQSFLDPNTSFGRARAQTDSSPLPSSPRKRLPGILPDSLTPQSRQRSYSTSERSRLSPRHQRNSSMDQSYNSSPHDQRQNGVQQTSRLRQISTVRALPDVRERISRVEASSSHSSTSVLEEALSPPSTELVSEILDHSRTCISSVITHLQQFGIPRIAEDEEIIDSLINSAITSIRDLLYVCGSPFGRISSHSKDGRDRRSSSTASQTFLVPAQRRAIGTLSKFLCSARAVLNEGPWTTSDNVSNLVLDAEELDRSVVDFVDVAQRCRNQDVHGDEGHKRLHGYFMAPHAGINRAGAGAAGTWKGYGWVTIDGNEEAPRRSLDALSFNQFVSHVAGVQEKSGIFTASLRETRSAEVVIAAGQALTKQLSSLLLFLGDVHIARHIDIDPVNQDKLADGGQYMRVVERARVLVRSFEAVTQALYDDGAALLNTTQRVRHIDECDAWRGPDESYDILEALSSSLDFNLQLVRQTLEGLLFVGKEQMEILERCNKSPIEWRMSHRNLAAPLTGNDAYDSFLNEPDDIADADPDAIVLATTNSSANPQYSPPPPVPLSGKPIPPPSDSNSSWNTKDDEDLHLAETPSKPRRKILDFFGEDAPSHYVTLLNAENDPWFLRPKYDPTEILLDPDGTVRGGTVPSLVERLTAHEHRVDPGFIKAFLMTYKSFVSLDDLFKLLVERFWIQPPPGLDAPDLERWRKEKQHVIRMRVLNAIKSIVSDGYILEKDDMYILDQMEEFVARDEVLKLPAAKRLLDNIRSAKRGHSTKLTINSSHEPPPPPIVPKKTELLEIDPLELARQLTITESQLYQKIRPAECLQRSKDSKDEYNDNISNFIRRTNRVANWVAHAVLLREDPRRRAAVLRHFITIADRCRHLQNFSTMLAIVSGLNSSPIRRLKRSWEQINAKLMSQLETCERIYNSYKNFNVYMSALAKVSPPCIPFIGVFLTALTHIQDGSKDFLPGELINFRKRQKKSEVIQELQRWQNSPHNFHPLPSVLAYLEESLNHFGDRDIGETLWQLSLEREPREKEEEKLARLLHESGFF